MEELTPSWHAEHTPDAAALVMGSTRARPTTYAELDDRSRRLAGALRARGDRRPATTSPSSWRTTGRSSRWRGRPSVRALLHGDQQPPAAGRGAVRARRLRRERAGRVRGDGRRRRRARPRPASPCGWPAWATLPGFEPYDDVLAAAEPLPRRRRARGPRDALLVGHDRAPEGRAQGPAGHAVRRPAATPVLTRPGARRPGRRRRPGSVYLSPGAAVPRRRRSSTRCRCSASARRSW